MTLRRSDEVLSQHKIRLIECFKTWQGEGPDTGRNMLILRFKTCNLNCQFCDTAVKMRVTAEAEYPLDYIQRMLEESKSGILLTGGEPTVKRHFLESIKILNFLDYPVANVESNGYDLENLIKQTAGSQPVKFIYSPKVFTKSDARYHAEHASKLIEQTPHKVYVKYVYQGTEACDLFLENLSKRIDEIGCHQNIYLMPEGVTRDAVRKHAPMVFDACEKYNFNFTSRCHIMFGFV